MYGAAGMLRTFDNLSDLLSYRFEGGLKLLSVTYLVYKIPILRTLTAGLSYIATL